MIPDQMPRDFTPGKSSACESESLTSLLLRSHADLGEKKGEADRDDLKPAQHRAIRDQVETEGPA